MSDGQCNEIQTMMSGEIDGELSAEASARVNAHLESCADCQKEYESMRTVAAAASSLQVDMPADVVWDSFFNNVYNRLERRLGWIILISGVVAALCVALFVLVTLPWATTPVKILLAVPLAGLLVLFISVLRQRLAVIKTDRYSNDITR